MPREKPARSPRRGSRPPAKRGNRSGYSLALGLLLEIVVAAGAFWLYQRAHQPRKSSASLSEQPSSQAPAPPRKAAATPPPAAQPNATGDVATDTETAPFGISEDVFEAGARLYGSRCASCHGTPRHIAAAHPTALPLWQPNHTAGGTGVSRQRPAEIYRGIARGAPAAGMPAYRGVLTSTQLWQLSLLLSNAGQDMPDPVLRLLDPSKP